MPDLAILQRRDKASPAVIADPDKDRDRQRSAVVKESSQAPAAAWCQAGRRRGGNARLAWQCGLRWHQALLIFGCRLQAELRAHDLLRAISTIEPDAVIRNGKTALHCRHDILARAGMSGRTDERKTDD